MPQAHTGKFLFTCTFASASWLVLGVLTVATTKVVVRSSTVSSTVQILHKRIEDTEERQIDQDVLVASDLVLRYSAPYWCAILILSCAIDGNTAKTLAFN